MAVFNFTDHPVNIIEDAEIHPIKRKLFGGKVVRSYPQQDIRLDAQITKEQVGTLEDGTPIFESKVTGIDEIPDCVGGDDIAIVSMLYVSAWRLQHKDEPLDKRLWIISDPVMESADVFKVIGCLGIQRPM